MAMLAAVLGPALKAAVHDVNPADYPGDPAGYSDAVYQAMAGAIIFHVQTYGVVAVTVASVTGVTTGINVSGPGTGTGTIT